MDGRIVRPHGRRTGPELEIQIRRRRRIRHHARALTSVRVDLHQPDFAELAGIHELLFRFHQMGRTPPLRANLDHTLVLPRRRQHRLAFRHVHTDRLLAIKVGARLHRGDRRQRMPVIRRSDLDDVQIALLEHLAVILINPWALLRSLPRCHDVGGLVQHLRVHVAQRDHLDRFDLNQPQQIHLPVPAGSDQADPSRLAGLRVSQCGRGGGGEEISSIHGRSSSKVQCTATVASRLDYALRPSAR
jgi:hypothetical protein